jgi:hypothetical protein
MNPKYPIYIVSKGRWESRLTSKALEKMNVPYYIAVEPQEYDKYASVIDPKKILVLPFSNHGFGPTPARNWCWEHSILLGATSHWVLDDNMNGFVRLNKNKRHDVLTGSIFRAAEDFVDRYENVAMSGFEYRFFGGGARREKAPYRLNTRIYSCLLIKNNIPYRWRLKYNEDTDLSLMVLKDGYCTILFQAFLCNKVRTQVMKGGNTDEFYAKEGTLKKSQMLVEYHPDVSKVVWRYGRWHHEVDYSPFKKNKLIKKKNLNISNVINNYGMKLVNENEL